MSKKRPNQNLPTWNGVVWIFWVPLIVWFIVIVIL